MPSNCAANFFAEAVQSKVFAQKQEFPAKADPLWKAWQFQAWCGELAD